ncbi:MAG TPA: alpha-L-rhamnosidase N-terminal domain-containing protein, partial [Flavisolibacter sp.]|nr:alpha-L-rhamnosidase N-terminal domain-containing protein [Flavisolibacter sp.]
MKRLLLLLFPLLTLSSFAQTKVERLLCENRTNPVGLDISQPRFSWQLASDKRGVMQSAYEIRVAGDAASLQTGKSLVWNSGKISSDQSVYVPYQGSALESGKKYYWQVRVWDNAGKASAWSPSAYWQTAFLQADDWKARWITVGFAEDTVLRPSPLFRKTFPVAKKVQSATAFITSLGMYEAFINGKRVGDAYLTPGWTSYNKRLQYQVYDVTPMLQSGNNAIGVALGNGWYRGTIGYQGNLNYYGKELALLCQVNISYTDGSTETVVSDDSWKS